MSYFEELWSAGRESNENTDNAIENIPGFDMFNENLDEPSNSEIFFSPGMIVPEKTPESDQFEGLSMGGNLKVLGIGGAGCNAVNRMIEDQVSGVEFIAVNTDVQVLKKSKAAKKIAIGSKVTKGLGAGARPEVGEKAAVESAEEIRQAIKDTDMVFITAGMGGGTGTGAAPIIAQVAKEAGCLVVAVVTLPFGFEGTKRQKAAVEGIDKLKNHVDTMLVISNSRIFDIVEKNTAVKDAFKKIDEVLKQAVQGIAGIISETAVINVDFNDVKTVLANRGEAIMGIGIAKGQGRALKATEDALANPLIENNDFRQAGAMVAKIIGGTDFDMKEFHEAAEAIAGFCREDSEIIMGLDFDENLKDQVKIIIVATDFIREVPSHQKQKDSSDKRFIPSTPIQEMISYHEEQNYLDPDGDWGLLVNPNKQPRSEIQQLSGERRSVDFSVKQGHSGIYDFDPHIRRSVSGVPSIGTDLDTPAFLRRKKRVLNDID